MYKKLSVVAGYILCSNISLLAMDNNTNNQETNSFQSEKTSLPSLNQKKTLQKEIDFLVQKTYRSNFLLTKWPSTILSEEDSENSPWYGFISRQDLKDISELIQVFYDKDASHQDKKAIITELWQFFFNCLLFSTNKGFHQFSFYNETLFSFLKKATISYPEQKNDFEEFKFSYQLYDCNDEKPPFEHEDFFKKIKKQFNRFHDYVNFLHSYFLNNDDKGIKGYLDAMISDDIKNTSLHFNNVLRTIYMGMTFYNNFSQKWHLSQQEQIALSLKKTLSIKVESTNTKTNLGLKEVNEKLLQKLSQQKLETNKLTEEIKSLEEKNKKLKESEKGMFIKHKEAQENFKLKIKSVSSQLSKKDTEINNLIEQKKTQEQQLIQESQKKEEAIKGHKQGEVLIQEFEEKIKNLKQEHEKEVMLLKNSILNLTQKAPNNNELEKKFKNLLEQNENIVKKNKNLLEHNENIERKNKNITEENKKILLNNEQLKEAIKEKDQVVIDQQKKYKILEEQIKNLLEHNENIEKKNNNIGQENINITLRNKFLLGDKKYNQQKKSEILEQKEEAPQNIELKNTKLQKIIQNLKYQLKKEKEKKQNQTVSLNHTEDNKRLRIAFDLMVNENDGLISMHEEDSNRISYLDSQLKQLNINYYQILSKYNELKSNYDKIDEEKKN